MCLALGLPLRNQAELTELLRRLYDPTSPDYRHFLTPQEFVARFSPTSDQYQAAMAFAAAHHLSIAATHPNRMLLDVAGHARDVSRAFNIRLLAYRHPTEDRDFFAPDKEPSVPTGTPILDVSGLSDYRPARPLIRLHPSNPIAAAQPRSGSAANGSYLGRDFRAAYLPGVTLNGAGQSVGLLEFDGFYDTDIAAYENAAGMSAIPLKTILVDGFTGIPIRGKNSGDPEVSLDIEMAAAMAPGLTQIVVYEGAPDASPNDLLNRMASDNLAHQLSCSWGWAGGPTATTDQIFEEMAAQGQSFFCAAGDSDAYSGNSLDDPSQQNAPCDSPYITIVGGTTLTTSGPGGAWVSESVWNWGGGTGSSGGTSSHYAIPSWQAPVSMAANSGSSSMRNIPDVALTADNVCVYCNNGSSDVFGGTSCAAPLWASLAALINQQGAGFGLPPIGFINPAIYNIGLGSGYQAAFHDVTTGNDTSSSSPNRYYAAPGYDLCSGWGTPIGPALIDDLAYVPDPLVVTPSQGFSASGLVGGPFSGANATLSLSNTGPSGLTWVAGATAPWLTVSPMAGAIPAESAFRALTVQLDSAAAAQLPPGDYIAAVWLTNLQTGVPQNRQFTLNVSSQLLQNGGFETADFSGWTQSGNSQYCNVTGSASYVHSGASGAEMGPAGSLGYITQTIPTLAGQPYLLSFWLENIKGGTVSEFKAVWNGSVLVDSFNAPAHSWAQSQFIVTGVDGTSTLQFGFRNDPAYFGFDDVSLVPVAPLLIQSAAPSASAVQFSWNAIPGAAYQVQYTPSLSPPQWTNLGAPQTASAPISFFSDTKPASSQGFFRVILQPSD